MLIGMSGLLAKYEFVKLYCIINFKYSLIKLFFILKSFFSFKISTLMLRIIALKSPCKG